MLYLPAVESKDSGGISKGDSRGRPGLAQGQPLQLS